MDWNAHISKANTRYLTAIAATDQSTAAAGWKREARFDRDLQDWVVGKPHTAPMVFGWLPYVYFFSQN